MSSHSIYVTPSQASAIRRSNSNVIVVKVPASAARSQRSQSRTPSQSRAPSQQPAQSQQQQQQSQARSRSLSTARQPSAAVAAAAAAQPFQSNIEQRVIQATTPIQVGHASRVQAGRYSGLQLNKEDEQGFCGPQSLSSYAINDDPNPEVIKKPSKPVKYTQEVQVKHLNPPTPPPHGDLIIRETQQNIPAGPPVVLRQEGQPACTPPPQIFREEPPRPPTRVPTCNLEVEGEPIPPPARRVVVEKLPDAAGKPQNILIEKWLPYKQQKRRVVFQRSCVPPPPNPRNLVIEWEQPCAEVEQVCLNLGVVDTDPEEYVRKYGCELKQKCEIPDLCPCIKPPTPAPSCGCQPPKAPTPPPAPACGCQQPQQQQPQQAPTPRLSRSASASVLSSRSSRVTELEGDVEALRLLNLSQHGLQRYRKYL